MKLYGFNFPLRRHPRPDRSPEYLRFIREFPCIACGKTRGIEAMHAGPHGLRQKASDFDALPGCRECHRTGPHALHRIGPARFQQYHDIDFHDLQTLFRHLWTLQTKGKKKSEPAAFYAVAEPCELCGRPADRRQWDAAAQLYLGVECCAIPEAPVCTNLVREIQEARTAREVARIFKEHKTCPTCQQKKRAA